jgi:hypothetical protein
MSKTNTYQFTNNNSTKKSNTITSVKVIFNLKSDEPVLRYTDYEPNEQLDRFNVYYGYVQAFQSGSNSGCTKKYKNDDGVLKIESSTWKHENIEQTPETRKNPDNWDETRKIFTTAEIKLTKASEIYKKDILDNDKFIIMMFNNDRRILEPNQIIEFGSVNEPQIHIH